MSSVITLDIENIKTLCRIAIENIQKQKEINLNNVINKHAKDKEKYNKLSLIGKLFNLNPHDHPSNIKSKYYNNWEYINSTQYVGLIRLCKEILNVHSKSGTITLDLQDYSIIKSWTD